MERNTIVVYAPRSSNRLDFVLKWLFEEVYAIGFRLVHNEDEVKDLAFFISYGKVFPNAISIPDAGLLWQKGIQQHEIALDNWNNVPTLYSSKEPGYSIPFDVFSALFFLLSRYEEYYSYKPDKHGRYPATESILYKNGWLQRPLIDEWVFSIKQLLLQKAITIPKASFVFQPTYDIDIAYSYLNKSKKRILGAHLRDLIKANFGGIKNRMQVLAGKLPDPYDSYDWILQVHKDHKPDPLYFILAALHNTDYDKNILPDTMEMQRLIKKLQKTGSICIHPSYFYNEQDKFRKEKNLMEIIVGERIYASRQHYIRAVFPDTYKVLLTNRITSDYSMGYGTHLGFRAGTGRSFGLYDLLNEVMRPIRIYPFCFMDTTARFEEKLDAGSAFSILSSMTDELKKTESRLITIFHNFSLGSSPEWTGWKEAYARFIQDQYKG